MFDTNKFKRSVKEWVRENPNGSMEDFVDFCEELIPSAQFNAYGWLVEQTLGWNQRVDGRLCGLLRGVDSFRSI